MIFAVSSSPDAVDDSEASGALGKDEVSGPDGASFPPQEESANAVIAATVIAVRDRATPVRDPAMTGEDSGWRTGVIDLDVPMDVGDPS
ncbi:hypothetical protein GCM10010197_10380 [Nocardioides luteus]|uniref:Uncharacterized protein n=1 Tax=Nocardioides luteus TaxID=1844 RepID=A0ABQ5SXK3_9ACTN|nr:hypothetical protein GCM10010197_10380 [Nocardioides luteus]GLJ68902.1 hypothetical protein GCM10017579_29380 [Nocardioides luteus]